MDVVEVDQKMVAEWIPPRKKSSHKRMNGTVCVVGGSRLYHGAPFLCANGALRSGVDLVFIAVPAPIASPIRALSPDFIVIPLPDSKLSKGNVTKLLTWVEGVDCFAVGPGLGPQNPDWIARALNEMKGDSRSLVVDADALRPQILGSVKGIGGVVTPHAREFERLFGVKLPEGTEERVKIVFEQAKKHGLTVLLKGPTDIVSDGERVGLNDTHTPAMTVGGTGDVLTGIVAGLRAKGVPPFESSLSAAYVNGSAGIQAAKSLGLHIGAFDVANHIANVMQRFDRVE